MVLVISMGSLAKFDGILDNNEFLDKSVEHITANTYYILTDDPMELLEITRIMTSNNIKYILKDDD